MITRKHTSNQAIHTGRTSCICETSAQGYSTLSLAFVWSSKPARGNKTCTDDAERPGFGTLPRTCSLMPKFWKCWAFSSKAHVSTEADVRLLAVLHVSLSPI